MSARFRGKAEIDFNRALKEICEDYDDKGTKKEDFMPNIDDGKSRSCIDESLKDSTEKVQFTKNDKIQEVTDESEEILKMKKIHLIKCIMILFPGNMILRGKYIGMKTGKRHMV